jgi:hypothetical protein
MNKFECKTDKISARAIGLVVLPLALAVGFIGSMILPVVGLFFSIPLFILAIVLLAAPESKACKLLLRRES